MPTAIGQSTVWLGARNHKSVVPLAFLITGLVTYALLGNLDKIGLKSIDTSLGRGITGGVIGLLSCVVTLCILHRLGKKTEDAIRRFITETRQQLEEAKRQVAKLQEDLASNRLTVKARFDAGKDSSDPDVVRLDQEFDALTKAITSQRAKVRKLEDELDQLMQLAHQHRSLSVKRIGEFADDQNPQVELEARPLLDPQQKKLERMKEDAAAATEKRKHYFRGWLRASGEFSEKLTPELQKRRNELRGQYEQANSEADRLQILATQFEKSLQIPQPHVEEPQKQVEDAEPESPPTILNTMDKADHASLIATRATAENRAPLPARGEKRPLTLEEIAVYQTWQELRAAQTAERAAWDNFAKDDQVVEPQLVDATQLKLITDGRERAYLNAEKELYQIRRDEAFAELVEYRELHDLTPITPASDPACSQEEKAVIEAWEKFCFALLKAGKNHPGDLEKNFNEAQEKLEAALGA